MKKIIIVALLSICTVFAVYSYNSDKDIVETKSIDKGDHSNEVGVEIPGASLSVNYIGLVDSIEDLYDGCDLVVTARVSESYSYKKSGVIFTNYKVIIDDTLKTLYQDFSLEIEVVQTGGYYEGERNELAEVKPLEVGETYLFFLMKTWPDKLDNNYFTPSGAYQGVFALGGNETNKTVIESFNAYNTLESKISGSDLQDLIEMLKTKRN